MNIDSSRTENLKSRIHTIRGVKVILDRDLATLYHVETKIFNQSVKRNIVRFPLDFMFQLSKEEWNSLRSQIVTLEKGRGLYPKYLPYAFTEQGVSMIASVLNSDIAIEINIKIVRAFVELRQTIAAQPEYVQLQETMRRIETRMDAIDATHLVDQIQVSSKITKLSNEVRGFQADLNRMSELLDQFQNAHIIIRRPDERE